MYNSNTLSPTSNPITLSAQQNLKLDPLRTGHINIDMLEMIYQQALIEKEAVIGR